MDVVLFILGILGVGAIVFAAYIFTVAARNYVSEDERKYGRKNGGGVHRPQVPRSEDDRRSGQAVNFPITVNGVLITRDRRHNPDRRRPVAA